MARLQRAMIASLSVIEPQNNVHYFVTGCQVKSSITMRHCWQINVAILAVLLLHLAGSFQC